MKSNGIKLIKQNRGESDQTESYQMITYGDIPLDNPQMSPDSLRWLQKAPDDST